MRAAKQPPAAQSGAPPSAPNVFWRSVPLDHLRLRHPRFVPLPESVAVAAPSAERATATAATSPHVRQGTAAWGLLRRGAATTASLPELVGLRLHTTTPPGGGRRRGGGGGGGKGGGSTAAAEAERRRQAALARLRLPPAGADELAAALEGTGGRVVAADPAEAAVAAAVANEARRAALFAEKSGGASKGDDEQQRRQQREREEEEVGYCRAVLLRAASMASPEVAVRLAWGQAQEAAALEAVLRAFPRSRLEEVGAFFFCGGGGGSGDDLRVGASPDALITHPPVAWKGEDLRVAAEAWRQGSSEEDEGGDGEAGARRAARRVLLRRALERATTTTTTAKEEEDPDPFPLLPLSAAAGAPDATAQLDAALDAALAAAAAANNNDDESSNTFHQAALSLPLFQAREAVEVKNHSPFKLKGRTKARGGGWRVQFGRPSAQRLADRLRPQWLLQAQAHALCCGSGSALVVSRCAISGSRIFRVWADEAYQRELLLLLLLDCDGGDEAAAAAAAERRAAFGERTRRMVEALGMEEAAVSDVPPVDGSAPEKEAFV
jgi:hypothetical protein